MANENKQRDKRDEETSSMVCPSCGYAAANADEMQAHMRDMQDDQSHTVPARMDRDSGYEVE